MKPEHNSNYDQSVQQNRFIHNQNSQPSFQTQQSGSFVPQTSQNTPTSFQFFKEVCIGLTVILAIIIIAFLAAHFSGGSDGGDNVESTPTEAPVSSEPLFFALNSP